MSFQADLPYEHNSTIPCKNQATLQIQQICTMFQKSKDFLIWSSIFEILWKQRSYIQCPQNMSKVQMAENWERFVDLIIHHWISLWTKKLESMPPKHEASSGGWKMGLRSTSQRTAGSAESTKRRSSLSSSKPANSTMQVLSWSFAGSYHFDDCRYLELWDHGVCEEWRARPNQLLARRWRWGWCHRSWS